MYSHRQIISVLVFYLDLFYLKGAVTPQEQPPVVVTYRQLRERGFKGTKYDAELMIAQGFTLDATPTDRAADSIAPFLGNDVTILGMHRISGRIIRPFLISGIRPDTKLVSRISGKAGYRISG
jgi:hypothetical protein